MRSTKPEAPATWRWKGHNTLVVDGTTRLMPDTASNQETYPQQSGQKPGLGFPITRLVGLISLSTGAVISYANAPYQGKKREKHRCFPGFSATFHQTTSCWLIVIIVLGQPLHGF